MRVKGFHVQEGEDRESRWSLIQYDDGKLYVNFEERFHSGNMKAFMWSIDTFMREESLAKKHLQGLIDRMFDNA